MGFCNRTAYATAGWAPLARLTECGQVCWRPIDRGQQWLCSRRYGRLGCSHDVLWMFA